MLSRLLYVSRVAPEAGSRLGSTLEDILIVSTRLNRRNGLTGLLFCDGEIFSQLIEGPAHALDDCYARIQADPRHGAVSLRLREPVAVRQFPEWSMCGLYLSPLDDDLLRPGDIDFDLARGETGQVLQFLASLAARYGARLNAQHHRLVAASG